MGRLPRDQQSGWHHVVNRGVDRRTVFCSDDDRLDFGRLIGQAHRQFGVRVLAYCLMSNHFHLVLDCPDGSLSAFMQDVSAKFTRHANERSGGDGPVFRGRFSSRAIDDAGYLANAVRYVHRNPLDIDRHMTLSEYRWSSHRTYLGMRRAPDWLATSPVIDWFASPTEFDEFVAGDHQSTSISTTASSVTAALELVATRHADQLDRSPQGIVRTCSYLLLARVDDQTAAGLAYVLSPSSESALRQAVWRAERQARQQPALIDVVDEVSALLSGCV